ncbi:hypothetical protein B0T19DRAFT_17648 [Cercophora scortea]|uniref:Uncharacterized protein n=1 Tax=Cercophora scortea TaxID=314031 RepID=A0AAE0ML68_9PEZI|nr:hypothetical protein B0T19DRAFT_17648 [Cercophora scortea]
MSQLALQTIQTQTQSPSQSDQDHPPNPHPHQHLGHALTNSIPQSMDSTQDSPTIGRTQILSLGGNRPYSPNSPLATAPSSTPSSRSTRKPAPSPLHTSSAVSPPTSPDPTRSGFSTPLHESYTNAAVPRIITTAAPEDRPSQVSQTAYYDSDSSSVSSPEERSRGPTPSPLAQRFPNEIRSVSDPVVTQKPAGGSSSSQPQTMAGSSSVRAELAKSAPRNSSMDSAISAISSRSNPKSSQENATVSTDIANLVKTAGSPEAVIQYLLKEKQSQSQQNAQLWRLVDKQRAMILGLNKDLERALKDKEKYRKKLKEVISESEIPPVPPVPTVRAPGASTSRPGTVDSAPKEQVLDVPASPALDSDSQKHSPIDVSLAPYPITPPADRITPNEPQPTVSELLDPSHTMPKPSEHAFDQFDHDAREREADDSSKQAEEDKGGLLIDIGLPPSRSLPREPPRIPPPRLPTAPPARMPKLDEDIAQFPPPPAPPPRKPPPAPLHLKNAQQSPIAPADEEPDTDTDYDDILEVDEIGDVERDERRGRRRTREEDEREREILARKEAEMRSLSKKSKGSQKDTPKEDIPPQPKSEMPASPRLMQFGANVPQREAISAVSSLAGVLNGTGMLEARSISMPLLSPGLPSSPRPMMGFKSPVSSPPLSPLGVLNFPGAPLSPRAPRAPIPLPPNTPLQTPSPAADPLILTSPKPLNISKKSSDSAESSSPTKSTHVSPPGRKRIYKGFVTEEYPDLLLPPNALPSIDIKVASSRMKPSRASLISMTQLEEDPVFTLAIFSRADGGELWRVEKDSASLAKLDQRLKQCPAFTAKTPDRSLFSGHAPAKLDARRVALNYYLEELLDTQLDESTALELCKYLSANTLPPNADETGSSPMEAKTSESTQNTGPGGRPFRSGYLTKRGKNFGGWKARFFILDGPHLKYYETPGGAHLGTIKLPKAQIGKQSHHTNEGSPAQGSGADDIDNQYRHAFLILEPKKKDPSSVTKHVLCAESDKERDQWVEALLRWIDYKDPEEEDHPKKGHAHTAHDRQGSGGSERVNGGNSKKKGHGQSKEQQSVDSGTGLIGVSYEATRPGDAPQGAPSKTRQSQYNDQDQGQTATSQPSYAISAPRDPQIISNSEAWGTKLGMGLAPPNQEEKKARKRSFFGFGPKTRTSSDGQDSLFGNDSGAGPGQAGSQSNGPVRQVFGASLGEAVRYNAPVDVRVPLPAVVYRCIQYLEGKEAVTEEGIFRLSGSNVVIKHLRERFNTEGDINLLAEEQYHDIHAVASLLKLYLRELPTSILTRDLHMDFLAVTEMTNHKEKLAALAELVPRLPQANATLLKYLIAFLIKIINNADTNKMTVRNVGIVFSPTLNIPAPVFALLLQNYEAIFGFDASEYELPVTEPENQERRPSLPSDRSPFQQERRPSDGRPSTSHSDSPHRQRLMEAVLEGQVSRSTPTPPPTMSMQQIAQVNAAQLHSRSTPTPPPQRATTYEPQFLAQPIQGGSVRPAYESGFVVPSGYDAVQGQVPGGYKASPGYDRPLYESNGLAPAPYDQPYIKGRRESAMFMGNLSQQGSKGRLRDEGQF